MSIAALNMIRHRYFNNATIKQDRTAKKLRLHYCKSRSHCHKIVIAMMQIETASLQIKSE